MKSRLGEPTLAHALEIILFQSNITLFWGMGVGIWSGEFGGRLA
jgi:hypothetical protein